MLSAWSGRPMSDFRIPIQRAARMLWFTEEGGDNLRHGRRLT